MRILILTDRYKPEARAAAYLSQHIAEELVRRGHTLRVLTKMPTQFLPGAASRTVSPSETSNGVVVNRLKGMASSRHGILIRAADQFLMAFKLMKELLTLSEVDVIMVYSPPLPWLIPAIFCQKWRRVPYVINLHDLYPRVAVELGVLRNRAIIRVARALESMAYRNAAQIIVAAPTSKTILTKEHHLNESSIHVIHNFVDTEACRPGPIDNEFRRAHGLSGKWVVLYAGLMGLAQDLGVVIEAARIMQDRTDIRFIFMGDGPNAEQWKRCARDLPNVQFLGLAANEAYYEALRAANVCVIPLGASFKAPAIPGKVGTIMAAGRPLIAVVPQGNDTISLLQEAQCGIWVHPQDAVALKRALELLAGDAELCRTMGTNGRHYAANHLNLSLAAKRCEQLLSMAIGEDADALLATTQV